MAENTIKITLVYAIISQVYYKELTLTQPVTIREAILASDLLARYPELSLETLDVGIFSDVADLDTVLEQGDRIEVYRPLLIDPKEARRNRAKK